ncbi:cache domain-containing protein [Bacillus sp. SL00103]
MPRAQKRTLVSTIDGDKKLIISDPFVDKSSDDLLITISEQLADGSGAIGINMRLNTIIKDTNSIKIGKEGYAFVATPDQHYIAHKTDKPGEKLTKDFITKLYDKKQATQI